MIITITEHWNQWLEVFPHDRRDVYFYEEYIKLYADNNQQAVCYVYEDNGRVLLFPFLLRSFEFEGKAYYDFETAYGYGGPISNVEDKDFTDVALHQFIEFCKSQNYLAGFVRFCPLLQNQKMCDGTFPVLMDRHTVAMNLDMPIDDVWMNEVHTKNRNVIKKGEKEGLTFEADYDFKYLNEFIALYNQTMDKLDADGFYYFGDSYYQQLVSTLSNNFLGVVKQEDRIISAAIFFHSDKYGHYHLSGSDKSALRLMPNNFMLWNAAKELHSRGVKYCHFGGGTTSSDEDSLLCFKRKFSKSLYDFYLGKIVFNSDVYTKVCQEWEERNPERKEAFKYFLLKYKY